MAAAGHPLLSGELERLATRLRGQGSVRLAAELAPYASRSAAARAVAQALAEAAQGVQERGAVAEPAWRAVPDVGPLAVGDQVAVTAHDLVSALEGVPASAAVWVRGGRRELGAVLDDVRRRARDLRLAL